MKKVIDVSHERIEAARHLALRALELSSLADAYSRGDAWYIANETARAKGTGCALGFTFQIIQRLVHELEEAGAT